MKTLLNKDPCVRLMIAGLALIVLAGIGLATVTAGANSSSELPDTGNPLDDISMPAQADSRVRVKCDECGIVESLREIKPADEASHPDAAGRHVKLALNEATAKPNKRYEVTVRMRDGASRVFEESTPANWRPGERVTFIDGSSRSND